MATNCEIGVVEQERRIDFKTLLELAEDSMVQIEKFIDCGIMLELIIAGNTQGVILLLDQENESEVEIKYLAISEQCQGKGYGSKFLKLTEEFVKTNLPSVSRIILCTAPSSGRRVEFYQRAGFRPYKLERDYFAPEKGYFPPDNKLYFEENGIEIRDALWFDKNL